MHAFKQIIDEGIAHLTPSLFGLRSRKERDQQLLDDAKRKRKPRPKIGLALSSGGAKGLAHVGVIQVLEEHGVEVDIVAGTSMGSYVGACWAAGCDGQELEELAARMNTPWRRLRLVDPILPPRTGFIRGERIKERLMRTVGEKTFDELEKRLLVIATDLGTYEGRVFTGSDRVADAVHASLAIPGICEPVELNGHRYVDGGVSDPLPIQQLLDAGAEKIIAVSVIPNVEELQICRLQNAAAPPVKKSGLWRRFLGLLNKHLNYFAPGNVLDTVRRSALGAQIRVAEAESVKADLVLRPIVCSGGWQDYHNFRTYIEEGRAVAEANIDKILALIDESSTEPAAAGAELERTTRSTTSTSTSTSSLTASNS